MRILLQLNKADINIHNIIQLVYLKKSESIKSLIQTKETYSEEIEMVE